MLRHEGDWCYIRFEARKAGSAPLHRPGSRLPEGARHVLSPVVMKCYPYLVTRPVQGGTIHVFRTGALFSRSPLFPRESGRRERSATTAAAGFEFHSNPLYGCMGRMARRPGLPCRASCAAHDLSRRRNSRSPSP
jgi:hypothetical protein